MSIRHLQKILMAALQVPKTRTIDNVMKDFKYFLQCSWSPFFVELQGRSSSNSLQVHIC